MALELHYNRFLFTFTLWGSFITHYIEWWLPNYLLDISALGYRGFFYYFIHRHDDGWDEVLLHEVLDGGNLLVGVVGIIAAVPHLRGECHICQSPSASLVDGVGDFLSQFHFRALLAIQGEAHHYIV